MKLVLAQMLDWLKENPGETPFKHILELLKTKPNTSTASSSSKGPAFASALRVSCSSSSGKVVVVEFACSDNSVLCELCIQFGWEYIRLSKSFCDLSTIEGLNKVLALLQSYPQDTVSHLHGSCPCTSWCTWHYINGKKHPAFAAR